MITHSDPAVQRALGPGLAAGLFLSLLAPQAAMAHGVAVCMTGEDAEYGTSTAYTEDAFFVELAKADESGTAAKQRLEAALKESHPGKTVKCVNTRSNFKKTGGIYAVLQGVQMKRVYIGGNYTGRKEPVITYGVGFALTPEGAIQAALAELKRRNWDFNVEEDTYTQAALESFFDDGKSKPEAAPATGKKDPK